MPQFFKVIIFVVVAFLFYAAIAISIPYIRFYNIKDKMKEAAENAAAESDRSIALALAETALDSKIPLVGDYFYQLIDEKGKKYIYLPETQEQQKEFMDGATEYFLQNIERNPDQNYSINIDYVVELYFPFYTHKIRFNHKEIQPLTR